MNELEFYTCYTLFDINTDHPNPNQLRNWNTIVQIASLRAQPLILENPSMIQADMNLYSFGDQFQGLHRIWRFQFGIEAKEAFRSGEDPVAGLMSDSSLVPMITGLDETATLDPACILTGKLNRNTYFQFSR